MVLSNKRVGSQVVLSHGYIAYVSQIVAIDFYHNAISFIVFHPV